MLKSFDRLFRVGRVQRRLARRAGVALVVARTPVDTGRHGIILRKSDAGVAMSFDHRRIRRDDWLFTIFSTRPAVVLSLFAATRPEIRECRAEVSDGEESGPGILSFCSTDPAAVLIPDSEFFATRGYTAIRDHAQSYRGAWLDREGTIVWRGTTTGHGAITAPDMTATNPALIQRTRLCLAFRSVADSDAKFALIAQSRDPVRDSIRLGGAGIMGRWLDPRSWANRRFAIDVDGNSNAWTNLFQRLLLGCCVIKIASPSGWRQWYYSDLQPWEHFVPVAADLSDLVEKIAWCRSNPQRCAEIAAAGQAFAMERTFAREMRSATEELNRVLVC